MARTPIAARLQEVASVARESSQRDVSVEQVIRERITRRELLRRSASIGLAGAAALTIGRLGAVRAAPPRGTPRIAVVGAGLAGLTAAYRLQQAGYAATVYEANPERVGGRCWTLRGFFDAGQIAEHGGEMIDQGHTAIRQLARELGFTLDNLLAAQENGTEDFFYFDDAPYSFGDASDDMKRIWQQLHKDVSAASYPTLYNNYTQRGWELDHMSITQYIDDYVPASAKGYDAGRTGMRSKLGQLLDVAYNIEYGAECSAQSSLNMLYLLAYRGQGQLRIFGPSNEKYHVKGGNDQITQALASILDGQIALGMELTAIAQNSDGTYSLSFDGQPAAVVDRVVLALPFSLLKSVNYSGANFGTLKDTAIQNLSMGTNSKLHVQLSERHWNSLGNNGNTFADTGYQSTWEVTRAQSGTQGILVDYTGGTIGASFETGTPDARAQQFLAQLEPVLPGITSRYIPEKATIDFWTTYPWTKGSYSFWQVGQYTGFSGVEKERRGKVHFGGEHTSQDFQGYLNGGVETGERVAGEILQDYKAGLFP